MDYPRQQGRQAELSVETPSWDRLTRRIGKLVREGSPSTRGGLSASSLAAGL